MTYYVRPDCQYLLKSGFIRFGQNTHLGVDKNGRAHWLKNLAASRKKDSQTFFFADPFDEARWCKEVDFHATGQSDVTRNLEMGQTPHVLQAIGFKPHRLNVKPGTLDKALGDIGTLSHGHGFEVSDIKRLLPAIHDPLFIIKSFTVPGASVMIVDSVDPHGAPVIVAVHPDKRGIGKTIVNEVTSFYGKDNFATWWKNGTAKTPEPIQYMDEKKGRDFLLTFGLQLPKVEELTASNPNLVLKQEIVNHLRTHGSQIGKSLTWSGHELQGRDEFQGLQISIENKAGSTRSGVDADGHEWHTEMKNDYGYIRGTVGVDKDHVDCFLGPWPETKNVFVIHQVDPGTGKFDEDKVMLGWLTAKAAREAYLEHYDRPDYFGSIETFTVPEFKALAFAGRGKMLTRDRLNKIHLIVTADRLKKGFDRAGLQLLPAHSGGRVVYRWQNPNKESEITSRGKRRDADVAALKDDRNQPKLLDTAAADGDAQFQKYFQAAYQHRIKPVLDVIAKVQPSLAGNFQRKYANYKFDEETLDLDAQLDELTAQHLKQLSGGKSAKSENGLFGPEAPEKVDVDAQFQAKTKALAQEINARKKHAMRIVTGVSVGTPFGMGKVTGFTSRGYPKVVVQGREHQFFFDELTPPHEQAMNAAATKKPEKPGVAA